MDAQAYIIGLSINEDLKLKKKKRRRRVVLLKVIYDPLVTWL